MYGQLRADDPGVTNLSGLGSNVFKDRGAVDRVDFVRPLVSLAVPLDGGPLDTNPSPDAARVNGSRRNPQIQFELQLSDVGVGIDPATVLPSAFTLTCNGQLLTEGVDYLFRYLQGSNRVVFESAAVFPVGTYVINVTSRPASRVVAGLLTDRANNPIVPNKTDGTTSFLIELGNVPNVPTNLVAIPGEWQASLSWTVPASDSPILGYQVRWREESGAGLSWTPWVDTGTADNRFMVGPDVYPLTNGTPYMFQVVAVNAFGVSLPTTPEAVTPHVLAPAPVNLVAVPSVGPYQTGFGGLSWTAPTMPDGETLVDYKVEYRPVGSATWFRNTPDPVETVPTAAIYGLVNGRAYEFRVTTVTSLGDGLGATQTATTQGLPAILTGVVATAGDKEATVTWNMAVGEATGGSPITDHRV